ncbi:D-alanine--D-alanine ligase [Natranaerovirga hydrolytica]|uniref:D-alanine--D-alanine ligase n=1 Tax=Natranaerovirga hydrolytica TaxID=680378 RepID=A0A4R1MPP8_9FIRM|nr:D-alanine--D-alanine ligase family protein [Natranaerovirga hydrolytica]TCK93294.1 D-alanine--D-alanine ligase [Natranaerovirga hydrolytica]
MKKINLVVLFGGQSTEHEVSCVSVTTILEHIDIEKYNIIPVGITKEGQWLLYEGTDYREIEEGKWLKKTKPAILSPDAKDKALIIMTKNGYNKQEVDVVFPVLHGLYGEDGTVQGLLELAKIPYVGCNVVASSIAMDKHFTKIVVDTLGINQAKHITIYQRDVENITPLLEKIQSHIDYPMFIKPSNAGSSVGVSKATNQDELIDGIFEALKYDKKVIIEEQIIGREIECAVLGGDDPKASGVGEIIAAAEFYDYDAKYNNEESETIINPDLPKEVMDTIKKYSLEIFKAIDGYGLSRVDFFVEKESNKIIFNEINTLPGFTEISMYPMLWEGKGMSKKDLVERIIQLGIRRYN